MGQTIENSSRANANLATAITVEARSELLPQNHKNVDSTLYLAEMRIDGIVAPHMVLKKGIWTKLNGNDWQNILDKDILWYVAQEEGSGEGYETVSKVIYDSDAMNAGDGFVTTYPASKSKYANIGSVGFAFNKPINVFPFETVSQESSQGVRFASLIKQRFIQEEQKYFAQAKTHEIDGVVYTKSGLPVDASLRGNPEINIGSIDTIRYAVDGKTITYFSAERNYSKTNCPVIQLQGWFTSDVENQEQSMFSLRDFAVGCGGKGFGGNFNPGSAFVFNKRIYVGGNQRYYEGHGGALFEVQGNSVKSIGEW